MIDKRTTVSNTTVKSSPANETLLFDEKDMSLLLSAGVTKVLTALERTSEEAEKVFKATMVAMQLDPGQTNNPELLNSQPVALWR